MSKAELPDAWIELAGTRGMPSRTDGEKHPYDFGFVANMSRLIGTHREIGAAFRELFAAIMFAPGHLDRREREMVAAVATSAQDCFY